jgi:hypothetical protein
MVVWSPLIVWVCTLLLGGSTLVVVHHFVSPRLPIYRLQVLSLPALQWMRGSGEVKTLLKMDVSLHNDNYVQIDVHALSFDVFYSDWSGNVLTHIGSVQDKNQIAELQLLAPVPTTTKTSSATAAVAALPQRNKSNQSKKQESRDRKQQRRRTVSKQPLWRIQPRANFSITDDLYLAPPPSPWLYQIVFNTLPSMMLGLCWRGSGGGVSGGGGGFFSMIVPTSGVAHIKASSSSSSAVTATSATAGVAAAAVVPGIPFTVSIVCDNLVDIWNMQILGYECVLKQLHPGWLDLDEAVESLREHALTLRPEDSGGVMPPPSPTPAPAPAPRHFSSRSATSWNQLWNVLALEEALQSLS